MKRASAIFLLLTLAWVRPGLAGDGIVVVMSSELAPYQEALAGVREELGGDRPVIILTEGDPIVPAGTRVVIAIGGKAALNPYPKSTRLVYCLAPGLEIPARNGARSVRVQMSPAMAAMVRRFKEIQPSLRRLGMPWISASMTDFLVEADAIKASLGVEIVAAELSDADDLPDALRRLKGKVDALWLPPDPALISAANLSTVKGFSWVNDIPFYTPSEGLAINGSLAAVSSSFHDMGRKAAQAARSAANGDNVPSTIYPDSLRTTFNMEAARELSLTISSALIGSRDRVLP